MADPTYIVRASFANPVSSADVFRFAFSRNLSTINDGFQAGRATVILDNATGDYSPENTGSPYFGLMTTNSSLSIESISDVGSVYQLFSGKIDSFNVNPELGNRVTAINLTDLGKDLFTQRISTPLFQDTKVSSLIIDVLSIAGLPTAIQQIDTIPDDVSIAAWNNETPINILDEIMRFGNYSYYVSGDGDVHFNGRYFDMEGTVIASYTAFSGMTYRLDDSWIRNYASVGGHGNKAATSVQTLSWLENVVSIPASRSVSFTLDYKDPTTTGQNTLAQSLAAPVSSQDFQAWQTAAAAGTNLTDQVSASVTFYGRTAVCSVTNVGSIDAYLTEFRLRGAPIQRQADFRVSATNEASVGSFGQKNFSLENELIDDVLYANDFADFIVRDRKDQKATIGFSIKNNFPSILDIQVGDTVTLAESLTAIGSKWTITGMNHDVVISGGLTHTVGFDVRNWTGKNYLILDDPVFGVLDDVNELGF